MPATPSGFLRKALPGHKRTITSRINDGQSLLDNPADTTDHNACLDYLEQLSSTQAALVAAQKTLTDLDDRWMEIQSEVEDDQVRTNEEAEYEKAATDDTTGYHTLLHTADDIRGRLQARVERYALHQAAGAQLLPPKPPKLAHLPNQTLPDFHGDILAFPRFWSIFTATVDSRTDLPNVTKLSYLLPLLKGKAEQAIDGFQFTSDNYDLIVQRLKERFSRSDSRYISMLHAELKRIPISSGRSEDNRKTCDSCEKVFLLLEQAGQTLDPGQALVFDLLGKFTTGMIRDLDKHYNAGVYSTLSDVRKAIEKSITEEELTSGFIQDLCVTRSPPSNKTGNGSQAHKNGQSSRGSFYTRESQATESTLATFVKPPPYPCNFCDDNHYNNQCPKYSTASSRVQRLQKIGRCPVCLQRHQGHPCRKIPMCRNCRQAHNSSVCPERYPTQVPDSFNASNKPGPEGTDLTQIVTEIVTLSNSSTKNSLFQTAKVSAVNLDTGEEIRVRLCLDTLSNRSYITESTVKSLNLDSIRNDTLHVSVFGSSKQVRVPSQAVSFGIRANDGSILQIDANSTKLITSSPVLPTAWPEQDELSLRGWKGGLSDDPFDSDKSVQILIGADYAWDIIAGPKLSITGTTVFLIPSIFGFTLGGGLQFDESDSEEVTMLMITESTCAYPSELGMVTTQSKHATSYPDIDEFWNLESIGITDCPVEDDDTVAQDAFDDTVVFHEGRYHVKWPWITEKRDILPSNYQVALNRFQSLTKRLEHHPDLLQGYHDTISSQIANGIIERVPADQIQTDHVTHYLPHHPIIKKSSATTKLRIVYDASSKASKYDVSLNECLFRGPVILPDLTMMLIRFRTKPVVIISDVEKAFLQVALQTSDRDVTRFLWYAEDTNLSTNPENLAIFRFQRVTFGIISSPFLLGATIQHHLKLEGTEFAKQLSSDIYVDNIVSGLTPEQSPIHYYDHLKAIFQRAGMNVQQFCSNSDDLMAHIPKCDRVEGRDTKVLGLKWNSTASTDTVRIIRSSKWDKLTGVSTKRAVLRCVAAQFDPLGLFQPVSFSAKVFLQRLWAQKAPWDEPLSDDLASEWDDLRRSLTEVFECELPRFLSEVTPGSSILVFGDASKLGYGAAAYLRTKQVNGYKTDLLMAKSRLAPIVYDNGNSTRKGATVTLPRLELLGSTIAATLAHFCRQALHQPDLPVHLFTDSECALHWIYSTKPLKRFVDRRVEKIKAVKNCTFHYVGTLDNPADLLTRGTTARELLNNTLWWHGPDWANKSVNAWPETRLPALTSETILELKPEKPVNITHAVTEANHFSTPFGISFDRFSNLRSLVRTAWLCFKFLKLKLWDKLSANTKHRLPRLDLDFSRIGTVFDSEGRKVTISHIIRYVQSTQYPIEISALHDGKKNSLVNQLNLRIDDSGHLRTCSRYQHADLPQSARSPVLLPKNHPFSRLVVLDAHSLVKHSGVSCTLTALRQQYWIPHGRVYVKKILTSCTRCKRYKRCDTFQLPPMPPWPAERVKRSAPFQFVGVDFFGPLKIKAPGQQTLKMWGCLFTCLSTRAVHLEPVTDQTPGEFFKSLSRFVSRRGCPQQIISDNGAQFRLTKILGDRAWKEIPTDDSILSYSAEHCIQWKFIVELAPWQGGHYERLVGVVKSVIKTMIGRRLLSWTDLITLLTETEAVVNSRPITYVVNDVESAFRVLRPIDFLLFRPLCDFPPSDTSFPIRDLGDGGKQLAAIFKARERYLNKLWSIWYDEYLLSLRERTTMFHKSGRLRVNRTPSVGEVVLLREDGVPRGCWRLARVITLLPSADGRTRAAKIRLANGVTLNRTINFLVPLEVTSPAEPAQPDPPEDEPDQPDPPEDEPAQPDPPEDENDQAPVPIPVDPDDRSIYGTENDDDAFDGFSQTDVDRATDLLHIYDDILDSDEQ